MSNTFGMDVVEAANKLVGNHQHCLEGEPAPAKAEEVVQTWAEEVKDHNPAVTLFTILVDAWNVSTADESLVDLSFTLKHIKFYRVIFKVDCYFVTRIIIQSFGTASQSQGSAYIPMCLTYIPI